LIRGVAVKCEEMLPEKYLITHVGILFITLKESKEKNTSEFTVLIELLARLCRT
jgi:hypothetical protein